MSELNRETRTGVEDRVFPACREHAVWCSGVDPCYFDMRGEDRIVVDVDRGVSIGAFGRHDLELPGIFAALCPDLMTTAAQVSNTGCNPQAET